MNTQKKNVKRPYVCAIFEQQRNFGGNISFVFHQYSKKQYNIRCLALRTKRIVVWSTFRLFARVLVGNDFPVADVVIAFLFHVNTKKMKKTKCSCKYIAFFTSLS